MTTFPLDDEAVRLYKLLRELPGSFLERTADGAWVVSFYDLLATDQGLQSVRHVLCAAPTEAAQSLVLHQLVRFILGDEQGTEYWQAPTDTDISLTLSQQLREMNERQVEQNG